MTLSGERDKLLSIFQRLKNAGSDAYMRTQHRVWKRLAQSASLWIDLLSYSALPQVLDELELSWIISPQEQEDLDELLAGIGITEVGVLTGVDVSEFGDPLATAPKQLEDLLAYVCQRIKDAARHSTGNFIRKHGAPPDEGRISDLYDLVTRLLDEVQDSRRRDLMEELLHRASAAAERAVEARNAAQTSAASVSESELAEHYNGFAEEERSRAEWFRNWTIVLIVTGIGVAIFLPNDSEKVQDIVSRLATIAAVFGLAGYLARQSSHHRRLSVWGRTIAVQLHTFEGYLSPINSEDKRNELRASFAARVFSNPPESRTESSNSVPAEWMANLLALLSRQNQQK